MACEDVEDKEEEEGNVTNRLDTRDQTDHNRLQLRDLGRDG